MANIAFVFPGQASQYVGMGRFLFDKYPKAKCFLERADDALGFKISELILSGPMDKLTQTENCQPAILTVSVAFAEVLRDNGINAHVMAGHSLGEYSALVYTKAMKFADAVKLVKMRGKFMQEAVPLGKGAMAAIIGGDRKTVNDVCKELKEKGVVEPAGYNSPGQLVIAGQTELVEEAMKMIKDRGAKLVKKLEVSAPFHSSLLVPAGKKLGEELEKIELDDPWIPYVDNYESTVVTRADKIKLKLVKQVYNPVLWEDNVNEMKKEFHITKVVEVGPGKVLTGLVKKIDRSLECHLTDDEGSFEKLIASCV